VNILSLDTALDMCSVAISIDGSIVACQLRHSPKAQAEILFSLLENVFNQSVITPHQLDLIIATVGPGAFTGLRVGISTARGISLATKTSCKGITTTEAIAQGVPHEKFDYAPVLVALDSKRNDLFVQLFGPGRTPLGKVAAVEREKLSVWVREIISEGQVVQIIGNSSHVASDLLKNDGLNSIVLKGSEMPDAREIAIIAFERWKLGIPLLELTPLYLRAPDAIIPLNQGQLRQ